MRGAVAVISVGLLAVSLAGSLNSPAAARISAQSQSCWTRASQQGLHGAERKKFHATCMKGSLAPNTPTTPAPETRAAQVITAPSGSDRTVRSDQCNAEAAKRGLKDSALQAFRKGCLASAAPVSAIETQTRPTTPTPAKPKLDALTDAPAH